MNDDKGTTFQPVERLSLADLYRSLSEHLDIAEPYDVEAGLTLFSNWIESQEATSQEAIEPSAAQLPPDDEFNAFFQVIYPELVKFGYSYCRDWEDSSDAAQVVMLRVAKDWDRIDDRRAFAYRVFRRELAKILAGHPGRETYTAPGELPQSADHDPAFGVYEGQQWVDEFIARLPHRQQAVMKALVEGKSYAEFVADQQNAAGSNARRVDRRERTADRDEELMKAAVAARKNAQLARQTLKADPELRDLVRRQPSDDPTRKEVR